MSGLGSVATGQVRRRRGTDEAASAQMAPEGEGPRKDGVVEDEAGEDGHARVGRREGRERHRGWETRRCMGLGVDDRVLLVEAEERNVETFGPGRGKEKTKCDAGSARRGRDSDSSR